MLIRRVLLTASGLVLTAGLLSAQTVADAARQNRSEKKAKRVYTTEDMVPAKPEPPAPPVAAAETKGGTATSKKKRTKEQAEAEVAAAAAAAAAAEALNQEKTKFEGIVSELTEAETAVTQARERAAEVAANPDATAAEKSSASEAAEAADAKRKELNAAFLEQRKKAGAAPKLDVAPPPPTETPQ